MSKDPVVQRTLRSWQSDLAIFPWIGRVLIRCRQMLFGLWQILAPTPLSCPRLGSMPYGSISPKEALRLTALRERFGGQPEYLELDINERRLQFARWLVEHGRLGEFPECGAEMAAERPDAAPQEA